MGDLPAFNGTNLEFSNTSEVTASVVTQVVYGMENIQNASTGGFELVFWHILSHFQFKCDLFTR